MTTFHEPQPQSRRAMRANERGEAVEPVTDQPAPFVEPVPLVEPEVRAPQFTTQPPAFNAEQFRLRADARENAPLDPTQALPKVDQPSYRPRSAEQQPSPFVSQPTAEALAAAAPPAAETVHAFEAAPAEHTLTRRELRALRESGAALPEPVAPVQSAPVAPAQPAPSESVVTPPSWGQPVSAVPPVAAAPVPAAAPASFSVPPETSAPVDSAPVASSEAQAWPFGAPLTPTNAQPEAAPVVAVEPVEEAASSSSPFSFFRRSKRGSQQAEQPVEQETPVVAETLFTPTASVPPVAAEPAFAAPVAAEPVVEPVVVESVVVEPIAVETPTAEPVSAAPHQDSASLSPFDALFTPKSADAPDAMPATQAWTAPVGHWSTQADLDDESQPHENTINRTVGTSSSATNALVLPSIPLGSDIRGPLTENGQITLTGSIDLSHALSSTGSTDRLENTGMDALFELHDAEAISTDSAPVRAIRAVSTHNTGHGVTHTQKPKGNRALTGLLIAASSMAVVVAGLLVAALAFNLF